MCGIAGFIDLTATLEDADSILRRMTAELSHRGPDDQGFFTADGVHLGHRRLAVIDLDGGRQPIANETSSVVVVANGEIYNYRQLREELEQTGRHRFRTASDTEVLVHLWEDHRLGMLDRLVGMFAFALWDADRRMLVMARDRLGQKPLYVHLHPGGLGFASELRSLMAHPATPTDIDLVSLRKYLLYDAVPAPGAILAGVEKLEPGQWLRWRDGRVDRGHYWDLGQTEPDLPGDRRELTELLWRHITDSVRLRLVSDVPLGAFLSGGIDSSTVVAAMAETMEPTQIETFSIGFASPSFDESAHARAVAEHIGTRHREEIVDPATLLEVLPEVLGSMSEPLADGSLVPTFLLSRFARRHVTVSLSGDGADELLLGYPTFQAHLLARVADKIPAVIRKRIIEPLVGAIPVSTDNISLDFQVKRFLTGLDYPPEARHFVWLAGLGPDRQHDLLSDDVAAETRDADVFDDVDRYLERCRGRDVWHRLGYLYAKLYLQDDILVKVDRASMAHGLEVRSPFLDHRLVELLTALPRRLKLRGTTTKFLLKKTMRSRLPDSTLNRAKKGFGMPIAEWIKGPLRSLARETLDPATIRRQGLFDPTAVGRLLDEHEAGRVDHRKPLWSLIAFQLWRQRYLR
jgi:asparagine synthase (glutamine-hydrolysing)